jgi:serine/threonine protein phosphatase PrpC
MTTCPRCQAIGQPKDRFCQTCGNALDGTTVLDDPPTRPAGERHKTCSCPPDAADCDPGGFCQRCGLFRPGSESFGLMLPIDTGLAALSDRGRRAHRAGSINQDAAAAARLPRGGALLAVADGVSMSNCAEAASAAAIAALCAVLTADEIADPAAAMRRAIEAAQAAVVAVPVARPHPRKDLPETTIVAALIGQGRAIIGWVGDSRAYLVNGSSGRLLTRDDSWLADMVDSGMMSRKAAQSDRRAHSITQCLGIVDTEIIIHIEEVPVEVGEWLVLCTDGLWNYLEDGDDLAHALTAGPREVDALDRCRRLASLANEGGGHDNISVALLKIA